MFAPYPLVDDGRAVVYVKLKNGKEINVLNQDLPVSFEKPDNFRTIYPHERRRKFFTNMRFKKNSKYRSYAARYFCKMMTDK